MSKRREKELQQIEDAKLASQLRKLGWEEVDDWQLADYRWRCAKCKQMKLHVDCGRCGKCEWCYVCK